MSLLYAGDVDDGGDVERDVGELIRCVAADLGDAAPADPLAGLDLDEPIEVILSQADPEQVSVIAEAMTRCVPVAVWFTDGFLDGSIDREAHVEARCVIDVLDPNVGWLAIVDFDSGGPFPFDDDELDAAAERCFDLPGADETLTESEELIDESLRDVGDLVGIELSGDERRCIVVAIRGRVDLDLEIDLGAPDLAALEPVFEAFEECVPIAGLIAEADEGGIVYSLCVDQELEGVVGWRETFDLGRRMEDLSDEQLAADPVMVAFDEARATCLRGRRGFELASFEDVLEIEALVYDGRHLWAAGVDDGGDEAGNVLVLDGATGEMVTRIETEPFSVEIVASDGGHAWVASEDGDRIQRVSPGDGTAGPPVELPGRAVGDLELSGEMLWATDNAAGSLLRLDAETAEVLDEIAIAPGDWYSSDLATAAGWLWLTNREDPIIRQLDPSTGQLIAEHQVESEFTMHLLDLGDAAGVYGSAELWRIDPDGAGPEQLIDGREGLDVDAAGVVGGLVAFVDEDVSILALYDPDTDFIEEMRFIPGPSTDGRDRIASDGSAIWLASLIEQVIRYER